MYKDVNWRKHSANKTSKKKLQFIIIVIILINTLA